MMPPSFQSIGLYTIEIVATSPIWSTHPHKLEKKSLSFRFPLLPPLWIDRSLSSFPLGLTSAAAYFRRAAFLHFSYAAISFTAHSRFRTHSDDRTMQMHLEDRARPPANARQSSNALREENPLLVPYSEETVVVLIQSPQKTDNAKPETFGVPILHKLAQRVCECTVCKKCDSSECKLHSVVCISSYKTILSGPLVKIGN